VISLGRWLLVAAVGRAGLWVTISGALRRRRGLLVGIVLRWKVTGILLLWRRGVSTGVVARTRKSRHIQTDSRRGRIGLGTRREGRSVERAAGYGLEEWTSGGVERRE
jgi:hypothetical protein